MYNQPPTIQFIPLLNLFSKFRQQIESNPERSPFLEINLQDNFIFFLFSQLKLTYYYHRLNEKKPLLLCSLHVEKKYFEAGITPYFAAIQLGYRSSRTSLLSAFVLLLKKQLNECNRSTYSVVPLWKVPGNCFACAALALARRLITVRLVGVIDVLKPPAKSGLLRPTPVACPLPTPLVGDSWPPLEGPPLVEVSVEEGVPANVEIEADKFTVYSKCRFMGKWGKCQRSTQTTLF